MTVPPEPERDRFSKAAYRDRTRIAPGARARGRWAGRGAQAHVVTRARTFRRAQACLGWEWGGGRVGGIENLRLRRWRKAGAVVCRAVIAVAVGRRSVRGGGRGGAGISISRCRRRRRRRRHHHCVPLKRLARRKRTIVSMRSRQEAAASRPQNDEQTPAVGGPRR